MTIKPLFLFVFVNVGVFSCTGQNPNDCRDIYIRSLHGKSEYKVLRAAFRDSLNSWMLRSLPGVKAYQNGEFDWKLDDIVFFSKDTTRAILFMSRIRKLPDRVDQIKAFTSIKLEGKWWFIFNHHVIITTPRKSMEERHTFKELSLLILPRFSEDGLVVSGSCEIYYPTIERETWFRPSRFESHKRDFLQMKN